jgi:5'-phosphate synthase pdxT subunit
MATVGVLALQGDYEAHQKAVHALGHEALQVRTEGQLEKADALLLPGGESSSMLWLLEADGLFEPLHRFCAAGHPVLGTCAGAILLARKVTGPAQVSLGVLDIDVERNAYGRQLDSFITQLAAPGLGDDELEAVFIRAPIIRRTGPEVEVVLEHDGLPILVRQGPVWAATFHPEMSGDTRLLAKVLEELP